MTEPNLEQLKEQLERVDAKVDELLVQIKKITTSSALRGGADRGTLDECKEYSIKSGHSAELGVIFFDQMEERAWTRGGGKIALKNWKAHFRVMARNGWLNGDRGAMRIAL